MRRRNTGTSNNEGQSDDDLALLHDTRSTPTRQDDYRALWVAHRSFMNKLYFLIIFIMVCVAAMIAFFLWSPAVPNTVIKEKKFFFFISLPLFVFSLLLLVLFRREPKLNILILLLSAGITGYAIGFVTVALFKSIEVFIHNYTPA